MCCKKHTCFLLQSLFSALTAVWSVNSHGSNDKNSKEACISSQFFLCIDHYKKYKKFKPQLECCICDKSIYSKIFVGILGIVFLMCMLKARSKTLWLILLEYANAITIENLHTQMYQNLKLTLFFLEDLGSMILICILFCKK
jgi:hypothetical protein